MGANARYAIYFVPPRRAALYQFGAAVLGYDAYGGRPVPFPPGIGENWSATVREPSIYGFHATLKAPFGLKADASETDVLRDAEAFARTQQPATLGAVSVECLGSFIAVVPVDPAPQVNRLAGDCVRGFDRLRAPLTPQDRERRMKAKLSPSQVGHLDRWGYPYVFEDFRFHMTLTGALPDHARDETLSYLRHRFETLPASSRVVAIDSIAVLRQRDKGAHFDVIESFPLTAAAVEKV